MIPITPEPPDTIVNIVTTVVDMAEQITDGMKNQEDQKSESEISFQVGQYTMTVGGDGDDDDDDNGKE